jgi:hypothetical protein
LETVKIILCGGRKSGDEDYLQFREDLVSAVDEVPSPDPGDGVRGARQSVAVS